MTRSRITLPTPSTGAALVGGVLFTDGVATTELGEHRAQFFAAIGARVEPARSGRRSRQAQDEQPTTETESPDETHEVASSPPITGPLEV